MHVKRTQAQRREATRGALVAVGRELFAERGFGAVGTEEIVQRAGVTRGALYHHFRDKEDLFRAVYETVEAELTETIGAGALAQTDPLEVLRAGTRLFLDACLEPEIQQIVLIDAPAVLGWEEWRAIAERYGFGLVQLALQGAMDAGAIAKQPVRPLAHVLMGALDEAALYVARADDVKRARSEVGRTLDLLLDGLRRR